AARHPSCKPAAVQPDADSGPSSIAAIRSAREAIDRWILTTPLWPFPERDAAWLKLELFQRAGSFKPRGALTVMRTLDAEALARGVTAISAGNHAMAVGYAAQVLGTTAKVVMPRTANPGRIAGCRHYGAEVVLVDGVHLGFREGQRIAAEAGRALGHPFDGPPAALGTASPGPEPPGQPRAPAGARDAVHAALG